MNYSAEQKGKNNSKVFLSYACNLNNAISGTVSHGPIQRTENYL